jgi:hypothetical protein
LEISDPIANSLRNQLQQQQQQQQHGEWVAVHVFLYSNCLWNTSYSVLNVL